MPLQTDTRRALTNRAYQLAWKIREVKRRASDIARGMRAGEPRRMKLSRLENINVSMSNQLRHLVDAEAPFGDDTAPGWMFGSLLAPAVKVKLVEEFPDDYPSVAALDADLAEFMPRAQALKDEIEAVVQAHYALGDSVVRDADQNVTLDADTRDATEVPRIVTLRAAAQEILDTTNGPV